MKMRKGEGKKVMKGVEEKGRYEGKRKRKR